VDTSNHIKVDIRANRTIPGVERIQARLKKTLVTLTEWTNTAYQMQFYMAEWKEVEIEEDPVLT